MIPDKPRFPSYLVPAIPAGSITGSKLLLVLYKKKNVRIEYPLHGILGIPVQEGVQARWVAHTKYEGNEGLPGIIGGISGIT